MQPLRQDVVEITGQNLTIEQVISISRHGTKVVLSSDASERMARGRSILEEAIRRGERIYGATTSVGPKTSASINQANTAEFSRRLLRTHNAGHGPVAAKDVTRATVVNLLNSLASGTTGARPALAERLVDALNADRPIAMHLWGSMGQSDMSSMADIALALFDDIDLEAGEALALLNSSAMSTAVAVLSFVDLHRLLQLSTLVGALSMEGYAANPSIVSDIALQSRPFAGLHRHGSAIRAYIDGSYILAEGGPRNLQDPLSFRSMALIHGAVEDNLSFSKQQIERELNSSQGNPVISLKHGGLAAVANFDMVTLCMALDVMRQAFAPVFTSSTERLAKLVDTTWSGLAIGLIEEDGIGAPGFNGVALFHKSITSEARLLTVPLAGELASSSHSNGVMDRASLAALGGRRGLELAQLGTSIVAMELMVAAQAAELRGRTPLGRVTGELFAFARKAIPFAAAGERPPNVQPLLERLESNRGAVDSMMASNN
ncbi:hypothetical protein A6U86_27710 [Rhizobium sp. AC27/96]|nr:hypothetical protein A6U86_27710 [Rhizobium sp. AC27/96]